MNTITHALAPLLAVHVLGGKRGLVPLRRLWVVGLFGALPDILNPHLSLAARMTSWSHGLPAWGILTGILIFAVPLSRGWLSLRLAVICSLAYLLHLGCDAVSGGINLLYPFGDLVWGEYWCPPRYWMPTDVVLLLTAYFMFRAIPKWRQARQKKAATP